MKVRAASLLLAAVAAVSGANAEDLLVPALSTARAAGCAGAPGVGVPLHPVAQLDEAARRIARGQAPGVATQGAGYRSKRVFTASMSGYASPAAVARGLADKFCKGLTDPRLTDAGAYREGRSYWVVLAEPFTAPGPADAAAVAAQVLALTNEARSRPRRCGNASFEAAPPLRPNGLLDRAAAAHANDMARGNYLEHEARDGSQPGDRATRAGYPWRSIGENIASGQTTAQQVVNEWVLSPTHCANLMNPRFSEMGLAYAVNLGSAGGIYWAQEFGRPR
jgi:uncharacterized protein YkwD